MVDPPLAATTPKTPNSNDSTFLSEAPHIHQVAYLCVARELDGPSRRAAPTRGTRNVTTSATTNHNSCNVEGLLSSLFRCLLYPPSPSSPSAPRSVVPAARRAPRRGCSVLGTRLNHGLAQNLSTHARPAPHSRLAVRSGSPSAPRTCYRSSPLIVPAATALRRVERARPHGYGHPTPSRSSGSSTPSCSSPSSDTALSCAGLAVLSGLEAGVLALGGVLAQYQLQRELAGELDDEYGWEHSGDDGFGDGDDDFKPGEF